MEKKKFEKPKKASAAAASSDDIFKAPKITREPANKQMKIGQKLILRIEAQGVPSPTYQWYQNGIKIPGAVNNSYVIVKTRANNGGAYTCEAKNFVGSVMSKSAMISFFTKDKLPSLKVEPENLIIHAGKSCKFQLVGLEEDDRKGLTLQWFFNGKKINGATGDSLEFSEVKRKYEGEYKVIALKNSAMVASNAVKLVVKNVQSPIAEDPEKEEISMADMLLSQELPSIQMEIPSLLINPMPPPLPVPKKPEGDALLDSLNGEDIFFDPGETEEAEDDPFFEPEQETEPSETDEILSQHLAGASSENSDADTLLAYLLSDVDPEEKKSPIVVVQGAPEPTASAEVESREAPAVFDVQTFLEEAQALEQTTETPETTQEPAMETAIATQEPVLEDRPIAPPKDEQQIQKLLAKKEFLEKLLHSVATMKQRAQTPSSEPSNPLAQKIARQKLFLMKLRDNVLAKKKDAA